MKCSLHALNCKVHNRIGKTENSIQSAFKFIEINLDLTYNEYIYHVTANFLCLNQITCELFMNLF